MPVTKKTEGLRVGPRLWIVKSNDPDRSLRYLYTKHGDAFGPDQKDAHRFTNERRAARAATTATKEFPGLACRPFALKPVACVACGSRRHVLAAGRRLCSDALACAARELAQIRDADEPNGFGYRLDGDRRG